MAIERTQRQPVDEGEEQLDAQRRARGAPVPAPRAPERGMALPQARRQLRMARDRALQHPSGVPPVAPDGARDTEAPEPSLGEREPEIPVLVSRPHRPAAALEQRGSPDERRDGNLVEIRQEPRVERFGDLESDLDLAEDLGPSPGGRSV